MLMPATYNPHSLTRPDMALCRLGWRLERIERAPDDSLRLHYSTPKGRRCIRTLTLALTVPAHTAAGLLQVTPLFVL